MIRFATDDLAPKDRFDHWREVRGKGLFGVTIELPPERRHAFSGSFRAHNVGNAVASALRACAYRVSRTPADIAHMAGNSLCIGLQVKGPGSLDATGDRTHIVRDGDMVINSSDLPYCATPSGDNDFHYRTLKVPLEDDLLLGGPAHDLFASIVMADVAFSRPFRALFNALSTEQSRLADPHREVANMARLALMTRGRLSPAMPEVRAALRSGLRCAAQEIMERDKRRHRTRPAMVAAELGISVRQLHIVFESAELSFTRTLSQMRIEDAKEMLIDIPTLPVTQIALACGFDSLATFYRLFNSTYGMTPGDVRELTVRAAGTPRRRLV